MPTVDKADKPAILTESDQILNDLKSELVQLKLRMSSIEQEQEQNRILVERLGFQEELANEAISSHHKEVQINRENYQVIAGVMHNLKSPVSSVVANLSGVIAEIDDGKTKKTLEECMNTASNVLQSFDEVQDFCIHASSEINFSQSLITIRDFFRDSLSAFQTSKEHQAMCFRLLVDKQVPETATINCDAINKCMGNLVNEIQNINPTAEVTFKISSEKQEEKYGFSIEDLTITIDWEGSSSMIWEDSWLVSVQTNQKLLMNSGFNLLKTRELIRKSGGHMEIVDKKNLLSGFRIFFPLTY